MMAIERCFFILGDGSEVECENTENSENLFMFSIKDTIDYLNDAIAIKHTHPNDEYYLSTTDRIFQIQTGLPWVLHGRTYLPCPPLLNRTVQMNSVDEITLIKDFYMLATGIQLPHWFDSLDPDILSWFFCRVETYEPGDLTIINLHTDSPSHSALILDDDMILHCGVNGKTLREPFTGTLKARADYYWRFMQWQPSDFMGISEDLAINSNCA